MLEYYEERKVLALQVDASSTGLAASLIQEDQPVALTQRHLHPRSKTTPKLKRRTFGSSIMYIMGRNVTVKPEHKPLESLMKKPLRAAPLGLQLMLVQCQRFPGIKGIYKGVESLHLADALSRAHKEEQLMNSEQLDINLAEHVNHRPKFGQVR